MESVTVRVTEYPGATSGIVIEEFSPFTGWVAASDVTELEAGSYSATVTDASHPLRFQWDLTAGGTSRWLAPSSVRPRTEPTAEQLERLAQAAIAKATRFLILPEAPLGSWGEMTEFGMAVIRPDYAIAELLQGLHFLGLVIDWSAIVTTDDVIRVGLQADPTDLPAARLPDVERALAAAEQWIEQELEEGIGIA
jgi:hypothetical protein